MLKLMIDSEINTELIIINSDNFYLMILRVKFNLHKSIGIIIR